MRFIAISDTHGCHRELELPEGDILLHSGDVCDQGNPQHVEDFLDWIANLDYQHKIIVRGNHDIDLQSKKSLLPMELPEGVIQLNHSGIQIRQISIWGVPFPLNDYEEKWDSIPKETQILLTHQPPKSILDITPTGTSRGEIGLLEKVKSIEPEIHLFGHIHASYGQMKVGKTLFLNASAYKAKERKIVNPPFIFEL